MFVIMVMMTSNSVKDEKEEISRESENVESSVTKGNRQFGDFWRISK